MKKTIYCLILLAIVACSAEMPAQNRAASKPAARPPFCSPCLFYGGDISNSNGIYNGDTIIAPFNEILVPFDVPAGQIWKITGLFTNDSAFFDTFDPKMAMWSVRQEVQGGNCGTLLASGDSDAQINPTGNSNFGLAEYTVSVNVPPIELIAGRYWLSVVPECTNSGDGNCSSQFYYISEFQGTGAGAYGPPEPNDDSFDSPSLTGENCSSAINAEFSAGVLGASDALN